MSSILTIYIKHLDANKFPEALLELVEQALKLKMKQLGLWKLPPAYLGYKDWNSWAEKDAFTELLDDCYIKIFENKQKLKAYIKIGQDIDGLVVQNIHWFLQRLRQKNDPTGYAVAQNTKQAVKTAISKDIITANQPPENQINNQTLLAFGAFSSIPNSGKNAISKALSDNPDWRHGNELKLKLSRQLRSEEVKKQFFQIICQLKNAKIMQFLFKNLVDAIKEDVRAVEIPNEIFVPYDDELISIQPDSSYEDYQSFQSFCEQIIQLIDNSGYTPKIREQLHLVFTEFEVAIANKNDPPSIAEIARRLNIARSTSHGYIEKIRMLVKKI